MAFDWLKVNTKPNAGLAKGSDGAVSGGGTGALGLRLDRGGSSGGDGFEDRRAEGRQTAAHRLDRASDILRKMLDSLEGGDRYRNATYGVDRRGLPTRNLFRHKREYPDPQQFPEFYQGYAGGALGLISESSAAAMAGPFPGSLGADNAATAMDDDYELRRSRTPVPEWTAKRHRRAISARFTTAKSSAKDRTTLHPGGRTLTAAERRSTTTCARLSVRCSWPWRRSMSASITPSYRRASRSTPATTSYGSGSTRSSRRISCRPTWSGGAPMRRGGTSNAWSANTSTRPSGRITTRAAT